MAIISHKKGTPFRISPTLKNFILFYSILLHRISTQNFQVAETLSC
nr:MAG TPA: hypothetical protein [Caudoviricetes sp.]